jgi:hypothetical protein
MKPVNSYQQVSPSLFTLWWPISANFYFKPSPVDSGRI